MMLNKSFNSLCTIPTSQHNHHFFPIYFPSSSNHNDNELMKKKILCTSRLENQFEKSSIQKLMSVQTISTIIVLRRKKCYNQFAIIFSKWFPHKLVKGFLQYFNRKIIMLLLTLAHMHFVMDPREMNVQIGKIGLVVRSALH